MHELKMQCQFIGFYSHRFLTEAQGGTFAEVELGIEPLEERRALAGRTAAALHTKSFLRKQVEKMLDGLRRVLAS